MPTSAESVEIIHPYVECVAGVQSGRPVIKGTRFPVSSIVQNYRRGLSVDEILREFSHLSLAQVHGALSYYYDHQAEMDREIASLTDLQTAIAEYPPTL